MLNTFIYQVRVRAKAGRNQFEAYFIEKPDPAEIIDAIQAEIKSLEDQEPEEWEDEIDGDVQRERINALETLVDLVKLVKTLDGGQRIRVAGTEVGDIDIQGIPAFARDPNRTIQELVA